MTSPTLKGHCNSLEGIGLPEGYITEIDKRQCANTTRCFHFKQ